MFQDQFIAASRRYIEINAASIQIYRYFRKAFNIVADDCGPYGNVIGIFFHDLMIHFTGILIQRESIGENGEDAWFPFVRRDYAINPFPVDGFTERSTGAPLRQRLRQIPVVPLAVGEAIPLGYLDATLLRKWFSLFTAYQSFDQAYLPHYHLQLDIVSNAILECSKEYCITNPNVLLENWKRYIEIHATANQARTKSKALVVGTRAVLQNRKLAANYLMQDKTVLGLTHGEITNTVFNEPLFGYADLGMCSILLDYGEIKDEYEFNEPLIKPRQILHRSSRTIKRLYRAKPDISAVEVHSCRSLYIPTMYSGNFHYGPFRGLEDDVYKYWQEHLVSSITNLTIKGHPKSIKPEFGVRVENRWLEECMDAYDLLILDYYSTAASIAVFSDKPVIFFDIGLRNMGSRYTELLRKRCHYRTIDLCEALSSQINEVLNSFVEEGNSWSNLSLKDYAIRKDNGDGVWPALVSTLFN